MFDLVLYQPQIPPNTGNIIRLCANSGAKLHLIEPMGFRLDEKSCRRAGLDYHYLAEVTVWPNFEQYRAQACRGSIWAITKFGKTRYDAARFTPCDTILLGSEQTGLPVSVKDSLPESQTVFLPMAERSRSLNLSNAAAIVLFEAWRQNGFIAD